MCCFSVKLQCLWHALMVLACWGHAQERDTVSAAVHAAGALLYPLRWQHIYLPLLPLALKARAGLPIPHAMHIPEFAQTDPAAALACKCKLRHTVDRGA